ncbi:hypothetical protein GJ698_24580 [Pseudoduganella sp. FT26W]|uniref:Uncharacterized protein n=1 Tax=Duganella aquatilis TaxID=2666082 RepID=A0A844DFG5_9BURK|nr:hypothetical protein [Duganella aquatilis]MRW87250.1 hypothetical protein [Duganella aquatilis]
MKNFIEKMKQIELQISNEHGPFELFALFRPDTTLKLWDVLVSAKWMGQSELDSMRIVAKPMNRAFSAQEIVQFSGIVIIPADDEALRKFQTEVQVEHGLREFRNVTFFDVPILHAYVITSHHTQAGNTLAEN